MTETWKPIPGYNGDYEASTHGRIKSWKRGERILKQNFRHKPEQKKFLALELTNNGIGRTEYVHLLVSYTFLGTMPPEHYCEHLDGDTTNNHIDNLAYLPDEYQGLLR